MKQAVETQRRQVIVDTDIGTDIDDMWALAMVLKSPEFDVRLIVAANGETAKRAQILAKVLALAGRSDIPVGIGVPTECQPMPQLPWVQDYPLSRYAGPLHEDGVGAICDTILHADHPVTLLCLAPLTNIAAALKRQPAIASHAHFVGMLGSVKKGYGDCAETVAEWNVAADISAGRAALSAPWLSRMIAPLDLCGDIRLAGERYQAIADSADPLLVALLENYRLWHAYHSEQTSAAIRESSVLFDTAAVHLALTTNLVKVERMKIGITDDGRTVEQSSGATVDVAMDWTSKEEYLDALQKRLLAPTVPRPRVGAILSGEPGSLDVRQRFHRLMNYETIDRPPVWFFGTWAETQTRWRQEGLSRVETIPAETGMDPDWEDDLWQIHGLLNVFPIGAYREEVVEETDDYRVIRTALGAVEKVPRHGSSIHQHMTHALLPTRESWKRFKTMIDPDDARRRPAGWENAARAFNRQNRFKSFLGGSLFGLPRDWMGVEAISCLPYDDPVLFEAIIEHMTDSFMALTGPLLDLVEFDLAYVFEDCCFNTGPLFSPDTFRRFYAKYYRKLVDFYHAKGVRAILLDSDGKVDDLIPCWLDSGIDIIFPIEVGTWGADPIDLRRRFGPSLRMMGGFNKHLIPQGAPAIRTELERLKPLVESGGYIPLPDHRIPPDCSLDAFRCYVDTYKAVLCNGVL